MSIIKQIEAGHYTVGREPDDYNGFGQRLRGATVYGLGNGIALHTYTENSFFLYVDGKCMSLSDAGLTDELIAAAFAQARMQKLKA